ncbi:MAG: type II toxin-antitoxin system VapC family toxin [Akkermansiaceae bacterium]|jgi:PIN domain nuclease of toxin-antitoxin system|nr:type II toxin-antitoxin system VapC family toxin [Akkermansiaceae bacterium]MDP4646869.1 type II toxin-antitoxin system VapC family toxin [Akkermansiaceae bacterium]MDP4721433.1 type II toxin-antitoxin system VapC family toxin [Akkermansiaceae bacterium]MDP4778939.1 type II toxin-antitoxin system VapC family toxin [Akkermansiaceae bacterium]MDP4845793.1 type II toxin-antitoxin system VapC family toxin [Akkermansiaceae bacterium]
MRILLDSHALLWWMGEPSKLSPAARAAIANPENEVFASAVSIWEIGLKRSKGKLVVPENFVDFLPENGIAELPFTSAHAQSSVLLPTIHGDPFDRALIAQCQHESLTFATRDKVMADYNIAVLEV